MWEGTVTIFLVLVGATTGYECPIDIGLIAMVRNEFNGNSMSPATSFNRSHCLFGRCDHVLKLFTNSVSYQIELSWSSGQIVILLLVSYSFISKRIFFCKAMIRSDWCNFHLNETISKANVLFALISNTIRFKSYYWLMIVWLVLIVYPRCVYIRSY